MKLGLRFFSKTKTKVLAFMLLLSIVTSSVSPVLTLAAELPNIVSYQGRLADASGNLLGGAGSTFYFKFSLWDTSTVGAGTKVWPTTNPGTVTSTVRQGVFNVNIGDTANGYPDALDYDFASNPNVYLQVEVSANNTTFETLAPRQKVTGAMFAQIASRVSGSGSSTFGTTNPIGNSVVTIVASSTTAIPLTIRGSALQAASLLQIQNASGNNVLSVNAAGGLFASSTLQVTGASKFYAGLDVDGALNVNSTTATSTFANGINFTGGCVAVNGTCLALSGGGIAQLNGITANTQTFATSSDANIWLSINSVGSTHTFTPTWNGVLSILRGGTGISTTPSFGQILMGNGSGYTLTGTSSLGIITTNVSEGSNLYFTDSRARNAISVSVTGLQYNSGTGLITSAVGYGIPLTASTTNWNNFYETPSTRITAGTNLSWTGNTLSVSGLTTTNVAEGVNLYFTPGRVASIIAGTTTDALAEGLTNLYFTPSRIAGVIAGTTTDALAEGVVNLYWTNNRFANSFDGRLSATTTLPNLAVLRGVTDLISVRATTTNATSTNLYTTQLGIGSDYITDLTGNGITVVGGALSVSTTGDWTGTFDGQEGSYYLANSFSTTSANTWLGTKSTTDLTEGTNLYYTQSRFDSAFASKSTTNLPEGVNLYFTDARVNAYLNASSSVAKTYANNVFTGSNTFNALTVGAYNGPLQANNGVISATTSIGVLYGGTGLSVAPTYGKVLVGNGNGGYDLVSTSTLGLNGNITNAVWGGITGDIADQADLQAALNARLALSTWYATTTDALDEGSTNLYFTDARARAALSVTTTGLDYNSSTGVISMTSGYNIPLSASTTNWNTFYNSPSTRITAGNNLTWVGNTLNVAGLTTSDVTEDTNLYYTDARVNDYLHGSSTVAKAYSTNIFTGANTFNGALTVGALNGPLQAVNGLVSATGTIAVGYGGTGLSTPPTYGQLLLGNGSGGYMLVATSSLGINSAVWGSIVGNITDQTDLQTALSAKLSLLDWFGTTTDALTEGTTNLYFTDARARGALTVTATGLDYNNSTGEIALTGGYTIPQTASTTNWNSFYDNPSTRITAGTNLAWTGNTLNVSGLTTDDVAEGSRLYFTNNRVASVIAGTTTDALAEGLTNLYFTANRVASVIAGTTTDALAEGANNWYFTQGRFDTAFAGKTTSDLTEGSNLYFTNARVAALIAGTTTDALDEGSANLYYTDARARAALSVTATGLDYNSSTGVIAMTTGYNIPLNASTTAWNTFYNSPSTRITAGSKLVWAGNTLNVSGLTTTDVAEDTNLYYTDARVNAFVHASTTIPKTYAANTFTGANVFNGAVTLGTLNGPLQAVNGLVSATSTMSIAYGGTGLSTAPTYGQLLVGNATGGYTLTATSSLGITSSQWITNGSNIYYNTGNVGIGTTSPWGKFSITNTGTGPSFVVEDSTSPDITPFIIDANGNVGVGTTTSSEKFTIVAGGSAGITDALSIAAMANAGQDRGTALRFDVQITNSAYTPGGRISVAEIGNQNFTYMAFQTSNSGVLGERMRIDNVGNIGIGTTSPFAKLSVTGNTYIGGNLTATGTLSIGTLSGVLQAINGTVSASSTLSVAYGGTGLSTAPSYGQLLLGNSTGGYVLAATSSLGLITTNISEGTNLYYTPNRVAGVIAGTTTNALAEGSNNLYYTDARARAALSITATGLSYNNSTGVISAAAGYGIPLTASTTNWNSFFDTPSTRITAGTNLAWAGNTLNVSGLTTTDVAEGTNLYFTNGRVASVIAGTTTDAVAEGLTNLYYTDARVNTFIAASSTIAKTYAANVYTALNTFNGGLRVGTLTGPLQAVNGTVSATSTIAAVYGGTGHSSYAVGDILYASSATGLTRLAAGGAGSVLKISGGIPVWGTDLTSSGTGGAGAWSTSTDSLALYPTDTTNVVLIGTSATSTTGNIFEVLGNSKLGGNITVTGNAQFGTISSGTWNGSTIGVLYGGTGTSTAPAYGQVLLGNAFGGYDLVATSSLGINSATWGSITGNLADQTDLQNALNAKLALSDWFATTTDALAEGSTNLYFTNNRVAALIAGTTTDALNEGSTNLYYTDARARAALSVSATGLDYNNTTGVLGLTSGYNIPLTASTTNWNAYYDTPSTRITAGTNLAWAGNTLNVAGLTTSDVTEDTNLYYTDARVNSYIHASSTIAKAYTANTFTGANVFNGAVTLGTLTGPLQAVNGLVSATSTLSIAYGGTGLSTAPTNGQILLGNSSGGYSLVATSSLGITSSQWGTNGSSIYYNGGNVGIGTDSPASKLHLVADSYGATALEIRSGSGGTGSKSAYISGSHNDAGEQAVNILGYYSVGSSNAVLFGGGSGALNAATTISFYTAANGITTTGTERMRINSAGNVGIGTTSISARLTVNSAGASTGKSFNIINTNQSETFTVLDNGNVGIGTSVPGTTLAIKPATTGNAALLIASNSSGVGLANASGIQFGYTTPDSLTTNRVARIMGVTQAGGGGDLYFETAPSQAGAFDTKMVLSRSGNLGLGTTSPFAKLSIVGDTHIGGNLTATGTLTVGTLSGPLQAVNGLVSATSTMSIAYGGTGLSAAPSYGQLLMGTAAGAYSLVSTSTLGLASTWGTITGTLSNQTDLQNALNAKLGLTEWYATTTDGLDEGSTNLYYTDARARAALSVTATGLSYNNTTGVISLTGGYNIPLTASTTNWNSFYDTPSTRISAGTGLAWVGNTIGVSGLTTTNVSEGTNLYYTDARVNSYIHGSSTIAKAYSANTFTGANTFNGTLTVGTLNGPLQANNGVVSATTSIGVRYGGTGLTAVPTFGQMLVGNGTGYTLSATSTLKIAVSDTTGTLAVNRGGTGITNPTAAGILLGSYAGGSYQQLATSSLGLLTTNIAEGTNLYWTNNRFDARLAATTTLPNLAVLRGLTDLISVRATTTNATSTTFQTGTLGVGSDYITDITGTGLTISGGALTVNTSGDWTGTFDGQEGSYYLANSFSTTSANVWLGTKSTTDLSEGTNLYYTDARVNGYVHASSTIAKAYSANTFTGANTFNGGLTIGTLNGPLQANNGVVSATSTMSIAFGGTGLSTAPSNGQILLGNSSGGYSLVATSSLGITSSQWGTNGSSIYYNSGNVGIGTSTPGSELSVNGFINAASGYKQAGLTILSGSSDLGSLAVGFNALTSATEPWNTAVGVDALKSTTDGDSNTAVGYKALSDNVTGSSNTALGVFALQSNTTGVGNIALGSAALQLNQAGNNNIALGNSALWFNALGDKNIAIGSNSLWNNENGSANVAIGYQTLSSTFDTASSTVVGYRAGASISSGTGNILIGYQAGDNLSSGSNNIVIGYNIDTPSSVVSNSLNIGNLIFGTNVGGTGTTISTGNVGIGVANPSAKFAVAGTGYFENDLTTLGTLIANSLEIGTLTGPLQANNGVISATTSIGVLYGGTGLSIAPSYGQLLLGNTLGGYSLMATSSLGLSTTDIIEGSNLYYTDTRARAALSSIATGLSYNNTTGVFSLTGDYNIPLSASTTNWESFYNTPSTRITAGTGLAWAGNTLNVSGLTTSNVAEGSNLYYTDARVNSYIHASTTIPKLYTANTFTGANTFNGGLTVGTLTGPLQAVNGLVSATSTLSIAYGGTGLSTAPTYGQLLVGNSTGGYTLTATSSLGITASQWTTNGTSIYYNNGNVGIGTTSPQQKLSLVGDTSSQAVGPLLISTENASSIGTAITLDATKSTSGRSYSFLSTGNLATGGAGDFTVYNGTDDQYVFRLKPDGRLIAGLNQSDAIGQVTIYPKDAATSGLIIKGNSSVNLFRILDADENPLFSINHDGNTIVGKGTLDNGDGFDGAFDVYGANHSKSMVRTSSIKGGTYIHNTGWFGSGAAAFFMGTETNNDISFITNSTIKATLTTAGNFGIGTSSPFAKLSVAGGAYIGGNLTATGTVTLGTLNGPLQANNGVVSATTSIGVLYGGTGLSTAPTYGQLLMGTAGGAYTLVSTSSLGITGSTNNAGTTGQFAYYASNGTAVSGTSTLFLSTSGNVGIGTTSPVAKLSVSGNINVDQYSSFMKNGATILNASSTNSSVFVGGSSGANLISSASFNSALGYQTFFYATSTYHSVAVGYQALRGNPSDNSGGANTAIGYKALTLNSSGYNNVAVGWSALSSNTQAGLVTAVGYSALRNNTTGDSNTAFGSAALLNNISGNNNTAVGASALAGNTTGTENIAVGASALSVSVTGSFNTVLGNSSLLYNMSATNTVAIGYQAGRGTFGQTASQNNVFVGYQTGFANTTGNNNTLLGYQAGDALTTGSNNIIIGYDIDATSASANNTLNIGNLLFGTGIDGTATTLSSGNIGIGTTSPYAKLSVVGEVVGSYFTATSTTATSTFSGGIRLGTNARNGISFGTDTNLYRSAANTLRTDDSLVVSNSANHLQLIYSTNTTYNSTISVDTNGLNVLMAGANNFRISDGSARSVNFDPGDTSLGSSIYAGFGYLKVYSAAGDGIDIDDTGKVGIGTTTPSAKLAVAGGIYATATSTMAGINLTSGCFAIAGTCITAGGGGGQFTTSGSNIYNINSGNVGIGTTSPYAKLSVAGGVVADYFVATSTTATSTFAGDVVIGSGAEGDSPLQLGIDTNAWTLGYLSSDKSFRIASSTGLTGNVAFTIAKGGNIGIGTTSPYAKLSIHADGGTAPLFAIASSTNGAGTTTTLLVSSSGSLLIGAASAPSVLYKTYTEGSASGVIAGLKNTLSTGSTQQIISNDGSDYLLLTMNGTAAAGTSMSLSNRGKAVLSASSTSLVFTTTKDSPIVFAVNSTEALRIASTTGYVGIGTTTPVAALAVNGGIFTTASSTFMNGINLTSGCFSVSGTCIGSGGSSQWTTSGSNIYNSNAGNVGIGSTSPTSLLSLYKTSIASTSLQTVGIDQYYQFGLAGAGTQFGNQLYVKNAPTTNPNVMVGSMIRIEDSTSLANTVRGLEVQAQRGTNTTGENTGVSAYGRTFGIRAITEGDAGGSFLPAGLYAESRGTTQGNAIRGYSASLTSGDLAYLYQDTSAFTGSALRMDLGNGSGSFTGNFLRLQRGGTNKFVVSYNGTTTIGDGTNQAGLQIGFGGICVDNDGSCTASTTGRITAVQMHTSNSDLAEMYSSDENLDAGDIVYAKGGYNVGRAGSTNKFGVIGIVSTKPGLLIGADDISSAANRYPIALAGRVPVKVSTEGGDIKPGDKIQLSSLDGIGMKATESGLIVGIALESFDGSTGETALVVDMKQENNPQPNLAPAVDESDDPCYASGGKQIGEAKCVSAGKKTATASVAASQTLAPVTGAVSATEASTGTTTVKVGKVMVMVNLGWSRLDDAATQVAQGNGSWFVDDATGELTTASDLNVGGKSIKNVAAISSALNTWSISSDGVLTVAEVKAKRGTFEDSLEVGNGSKPSGITIFDSVTGAPFCLEVRNGSMVSTAGKCAASSGTTNTNSNTNTSTNTNTDTQTGGETPGGTTTGNNSNASMTPQTGNSTSQAESPTTTSGSENSGGSSSSNPPQTPPGSTEPTNSSTLSDTTGLGPVTIEPVSTLPAPAAKGEQAAPTDSSSSSTPTP